MSVVEDLDVLEDAGPGLVTRSVVLLMDQLGLQRVEERLLHRVVEAVALPAHAANQAMFFEELLVVLRRVLAATIRVMHEAGSSSTSAQGHP